MQNKLNELTEAFFVVVFTSKIFPLYQLPNALINNAHKLFTFQLHSFNIFVLLL